MKSKFTWVVTLCMALFIQISFAQEKSISGTVVSKTDKMTMPGVNIVVKGTKRSTQTDFNGEFTIKASVGEKLEISSIGSKTQTITVGTSNNLQIVLEDETKMLEDVVVEAYGVTRTKKASNVSSQTIGAKTIEGRPNASFVATLQGQVAGLQIGTESGQPGSGSYAVIRGSGSLSGEDEPLYVIDGMPMVSDNFRNLNPDEIESVSVLKDAGATSVYGNRGANGVIVVKTKRGSFDSALDFRYVSSTGYSKFQDSKFDYMNSQQLLKFERTYQTGPGWNGIPGGAQPVVIDDVNYGLSDADIAAAATTDWRDSFFRTGVTQSHTLNITSGSNSLASSTTFGYFNQQGTVVNSGLQRFTFRNNLSGKSADNKFNYGTSLSINFGQNSSLTSPSGTNIFFNPIWSGFLGHPSLSPSQYTSGEDLWNQFSSGDGTILAPLTLVDYMKYNENRSEDVKGVANVEASYKFTDKLKFSTNFGVDFTSVDSYSFTHPDSFIGWANGNNVPNRPRGFQTQTFGKTAQFNFVNKLNYRTILAEKHTIDATAFLEYNKAHTNGFNYRQTGLDPKQATPGTGIGYITDDPSNPDQFPTVGATKASTGLFSYFGTVDYDYINKFGVGVTLRRDASSRFANTNRWGTFWSITGRWNIDRENFMKGSVFSSLKLRGSIGTNGNQDLLGGAFSGLNLTREIYGASNGYGTLPGYVVQQLAITDLRWETSKQTNLGVDFEVFNRKLSGTVDVYRKETLDLYQNVPVSPITGTPAVQKNYGDLYNQGLELTLRWDVLKSVDGFNFKLNFNGSYNQSKVTDVADEDGILDGGTSVLAEGHPINEFFIIRYAGVNPANGNLLFLDKDGNPTENPTNDDRVYTGKTALPKYQGGFGFDADYKGFYVSTQFSYALESYKFNYDLYWAQNPVSLGIFNLSTDMLDAWTPTNQYTDIPAINATNLSQVTSSDKLLKDASFLRLRYTSFGYNFSKKNLAKTPFKALKIYGQAENLLTMTKWSGLDVQNPSSSSALAYPTSKIVSMGLQIEF